VDVPGSEALENLDQLLMQGGQVRYFAKPLSRTGRLEKLTIASYADEVAPTFVGITAELAGTANTTSADARRSGVRATSAPASSRRGDRARNEAAAGRWGAGLNVLLLGGGASHDYQRWFNLADVAMLNAAGDISAGYLEPPDARPDLIRGADVLVISANKAFPDPASREAIMAHAAAGKGMVLLHPGLWYNWPDWPEYNRVLAGGGARGHDRLGEFEVVLKEGTRHPILRG